MHGLRLLMISFSIFLSVNTGFSQKIDIQDFNHKYLEFLIKTGVDSLRTLEGLQKLQNDFNLYLAAQNHAGYMIGTGILSHYQEKETEKTTPYDRIVFYGGKFSITAENIANTYVHLPVTSDNKSDRPIIIKDYKSLADTFVEGWKNSPGHYKNIITPELNLTGVAVSYNPLTQIVFAVHKFGKMDSLPDVNIFNHYCPTKLINE